MYVHGRSDVLANVTLDSLSEKILRSLLSINSWSNLPCFAHHFVLTRKCWFLDWASGSPFSIQWFEIGVEFSCDYLNDIDCTSFRHLVSAGIFTCKFMKTWNSLMTWSYKVHPFDGRKCLSSTSLFFLVPRDVAQVYVVQTLLFFDKICGDGVSNFFLLHREAGRSIKE